MVLNNGVVRGSHGHRRAGFPMDVRAELTRGSYGWRKRDPWITR